MIRDTYKPIIVPGVKTSMSVWTRMVDAHSCASILQEAITASVKLATMLLIQSTSLFHLSIHVIQCEVKQRSIFAERKKTGAQLKRRSSHEPNASKTTENMAVFSGVIRFGL